MSRLLFSLFRFGFLGSIDSNTGSPDLGWDTDQFPMDIKNCTLVMKVRSISFWCEAVKTHQFFWQSPTETWANAHRQWRNPFQVLERFNPLHPNTKMHILQTVLFTFPMVLTRRIELAIKSFLNLRSFPFKFD